MIMLIPEWKVTVMVLGTSTGTLANVVRGADSVKKIAAPMISVAVENDEHKIIIDTGYHSAEWTTENVIESHQTEDQKIQNTIKKLGWTVDDVDTILNTHLHYDHVGNNSLFKNARMYVSKTEWEFANNPPANAAIFYLPELFLPSHVNFFQWNFIDGETEIYPGISMFPTPGHTPGHMSVLINTAQGVVCFAGDQVAVMQNLYNRSFNGIMNNFDSSFKSFDMIEQRANFVIPGHDWELKAFQTDGFFPAKP